MKLALIAVASTVVVLSLSAQAGDKVAFEFRAEGMAATIVSIKPLK